MSSVKPSTFIQVQERVLELVRDLKPGSREARMDCVLIDDLEFNSLALLELMFACEEEFGIEQLDEERALNITTVADIVKYVAEQTRTEA
jgi:acyl carrier protein